MEELFDSVMCPSRQSLPPLTLIVIAYCLGAVGGCSLTRSKTEWRQPDFAVPDYDGVGKWSLAASEDNYARAVYLEESNNPECVQHYFQVATYTWPVLERELATTGKTSPRTTELYRSSLAKLLITAQKFNCWDPCRGLVTPNSGCATLLPACYQGFVWSPTDFQHLLPSGDYESPNLTRRFRDNGLGVPIVVVRNTAAPQPFTRNEQAFAATVVLRPDTTKSGYQLVFYDPLRASNIVVAGCQVPLVRDLTAPFALKSQNEDRQWLENFLQPGATGSGDGLTMVEPYQPGKIPVVFIHGLLSDPATWADLANELRAHPNLNDRYQLWAFEYDTGEPFLTSAAVLRRQLVQMRCTYDPERIDPAMSQMVLVGHSMGGLVAKLQVTQSGDQLWQAVARQPLGSVSTDHATRKQLQEAFYFQPSMDIARVLFIGTPHRGSSWAHRPVGLLGSALVEPSSDTQSSHSQLVGDNPHLFGDELGDRFPTSIDLLKPESPLLSATASLPFSPRVTLHSIVGQGQTSWKGEPTDGVVSVSSAQLLGVASELTVDSKHEKLHRDPTAVGEVVRILQEHLQQSSIY